MNKTTNNQPLQFSKRKVANLNSARPAAGHRAASWPTILTNS